MPVSINGSNTPTAGGAVYGDGTAYATTAAGTAGQVLTSAGSGAPIWGSAGVTATAKGSVLGFSNYAQAGSSGVSTVTAFGTPNLFTTPLRTSAVQFSSSTSTTTGTVRAPSYSTYYGGWFCIMQQISPTTVTFQSLMFSYDGFSWIPVSTSETPGWPGSNGLAIGACANDYNGNLYVLISRNGSGTTVIVTSTDSGLTYGSSQTVDASFSLSISTGGGMCFIDCGTQATSRAVAWYMNSNNVFVYQTLAGNGNPVSGWGIPSNGSVAGVGALALPYRQYGTKLITYGSTIIVYNAATNVCSQTTPTAIGTTSGSVNQSPLSIAFNDSYWISTTGTGIRYGTVSGANGTTLTAVGTVTLTSSGGGTLYDFFYDGTYWYTAGNNGLWYTAAANPATGWTKATLKLGYATSQSGLGIIGTDHIVAQRNPV